MQVCTSLQTDNHASTPPLSFFQAGCPSCRPTNSVKELNAIFVDETKTKTKIETRVKSEIKINGILVLMCSRGNGANFTTSLVVCCRLPCVRCPATIGVLRRVDVRQIVADVFRSVRNNRQGSSTPPRQRRRRWSVKFRRLSGGGGVGVGAQSQCSRLPVLQLCVAGPPVTSLSCSDVLVPRVRSGWLGSRVVSALASGAVGPGFKSQPRRCRVTVLGKLFTPIVPLFTKQRNW